MNGWSSKLMIAALTAQAFCFIVWYHQIRELHTGIANAPRRKEAKTAAGHKTGKSTRAPVTTTVTTNTTERAWHMEDLSDYYTKYYNARSGCDHMQIGPVIYTENVNVAMEGCFRDPRCVFFTRYGDEVPVGIQLPNTHFPMDENIKSGFTIMCSGYPGYDPNPINKGWWSMRRKGCDSSGADKGVAKMLPGFHKKACPDQPVQCGQCEVGKHLVMNCHAHGQHVCHECPDAACPVPQLSVHPDFARLMQDQADKLSQRLGRPFFAYNPTLTTHKGATMVLARVTDQAKCVPTWGVSPAQPFESWVLLCTLSSTSGGTWPTLTACRHLEINLPELLRNTIYKASPPTREKDLFVSDTAGLEDARAFSIDGRFYVVGAAVLKRTVEEAIVTRQVLVGLDDGLERGISAKILYPAMDGKCVDTDITQQKNWVFLHSDGLHLVFAYFLHPLIVIRCDVHTGCCRRDGSASTNLNATDISGYRGSTPAVRSLDGKSYFMVLHKQAQFATDQVPSLPTAYHNKVVSISAEAPFTFLGASPPFRLPTLMHNQGGDLMKDEMQDLQFVAGLHLAEDGSALITYGVGDCASAMVRADSLDVFKSAAAPAAELRIASDGVRVRMEGPFKSMQTFAKVNRLMADGLAGADRFRLDVIDTSNQQDLRDWNRYLNSTGRSGAGRWASNIILGSLKNARSASHADVTIRNLMPLQLHKPVRGDLVVNFVWEFFHVPDAWAKAMTKQAKEIWVPTSFVKNGLVSSGVPEEQIAVVPHGVDKTEVCLQPSEDTHGFAARAARAQVREEVEKACGRHAMVFLYNGGPLHKKGFDLIVEAYHEAFTRRDQVCLVMHSSYWDGKAFDSVQERYQRAQSIRNWRRARSTGAGQPATKHEREGWQGGRIMAKLTCTRDDACIGFCEKDGGAIEFFHDDANLALFQEGELQEGEKDQVGDVCFAKDRETDAVEAPRMLVTTRVHSDVERAELLRLSGALVNPARSEDSGLGVAEAMACGVPVVTADQGAVTDFTDEASVWKVKTRSVLCSEAPCSVDALGQHRVFGELMSKPPLWLEYDMADMARVFRRMYMEPEQLAEKTRRAQARVEESLSGPQVQQLIRERVTSLSA